MSKIFKADEESRKEHKKFETERLESRARLRDEQMKKESNNRKELIAKGILKYVKNVGLVNTETGDIVKL